jgi:hypothetical protein
MPVTSIQRLLVSLVFTGLLILTVCLGIAHGATQVRSGPSAVTARSLWVTPLSLDFGPVGVDLTSDPQVVTITNVSSHTLPTFVGGGVYPPFYVSGSGCVGLAPGASCQFNYSFSPTATGTFTTTSTTYVGGELFSVALRGAGVGPGLTVNPLSLDFGSVVSGTTSSPQVVTIKNTGASLLTNFAGGSVPPPFSVVGSGCAGGLLPGESCQFTYRFSPTAAGTFTDTSSTYTNAGTFVVELQGRGRTFLSSGQRVTPRSLDFGPVGVGTTSDPLVVTITNQSFLTLTNFAGGGVYPPFSALQNCAGGVPPLASCQYFFRFAPTATGVFSTTSNSSNSAGSFSIALRGTGVGPGLTASPLSLDFGPVPIGETSDPQLVTIRNTGMSTLTNFAGGGVYPPFSATQNCAGGVPPGESCHYTFHFAPTEKGRFATTSNSSTNAGALTIYLQGGKDLLVFLPLVLR